MTDRLVSANKIGAAVAAYTAHINRENRERRIEAEADRRALAKIDKAVGGIMAAIEDGLYQPAMKARIAELDREKAEITARLAEAPQNIRYPSRHRRNLQAQGRTADRDTCGPGNGARRFERHSLARWQDRAASRREARRNPCYASRVVDGDTRLR
ncbi:hypothetical protein [Sphingopyxis sp.]|jgi:hypothetical protein|uniref:hypothetical protein n=1 Tax=Sphingopyxis sp. TaxID=1908224 RepID=UPI00311F95BC